VLGMDWMEFSNFASEDRTADFTPDYSRMWNVVDLLRETGTSLSTFV